jgi:zinc finger protein
MQDTSKVRWETFFGNLTEAIEGRREFTLVLEDPLAGSYVQSLTAPAPDPKLTIEDYDRTEQEEEDLGLRDIRVEGYESDHEREVEAQRVEDAKEREAEDAGKQA